jgi:carbamoyltransferase
MCLVEDGRVIRAVNLERMTGYKFALAVSPLLIEATRRAVVPGQLSIVDAMTDIAVALPNMLKYLTGEADPGAAGIDLVVSAREHVRARRTPERQDLERTVREFFAGRRQELEVEHHLLHAHQAYLPSSFDDAAVLTVDGQGDEVDRHGGVGISTTLGIAEGLDVRILSEVPMPSSVGGLYGRVTRHLGFAPQQEGNTMALAAFGGDRFYRLVADTVVLHEDGRFSLTSTGASKPMDVLGHLDFVRRLNEFCPPRARHEPLGEVHSDVAFGVQALTERIVLNAARALQTRTGKKRLVMAGGVALNCVTNARILNETPFEELYVVPNAGDRGLALGAALFGYHVVLGHAGRCPPGHDYLGRPYDERETRAALEAADVPFRQCSDIARDCARLIAAGRIIGWVQGGAEFGPRALGHRSILADPRTTASKKRLDEEIKRREWFRPYAPSVLAERADDFFEMRGPSPYMLQAVQSRPLARERVPGVVHTDGTARVQTVERAQEPLFYDLIRRFDEVAGVPVVMNTSFNGYGKPMVETPTDALRELGNMSLDAVAIGSFLAWSPGRDPFQGLEE